MVEPDGTAGVAPARVDERRLADFKADPRLLMLAAMALLIGSGGAFAAWVLVKLIVLVTNLVWFGAADTLSRPMGSIHRGPWTVAAPALGGLVIGLVQAFNDGFTWMTPGSDWTQSIVFAILILILVLRPEGLLGERTPEGG